MSTPADDPLVYYALHSPVTDPGAHADRFAGLPTGMAALCETVQGLLVHIFWAERHGLTVPEERQQELQIRPVERKLARILEMDDRPLTEARPLGKRLVGNCRDFSVLLTAILRSQGVPARARCGFGAYFVPGRYEDHWVTEYWHASAKRWVLVDPQLDALQREVLHIAFDPCDVPRDQFLTGGRAWQMCRRAEADPELFGIFDMHGLWFVCGDLVRDFLALNKVEILPWDCWGLMMEPDQEQSPEHLAELDHIAELTLAGNELFSELRALCEGDDRLRPPADWRP
jgi:hypothetical protein